MQEITVYAIILLAVAGTTRYLFRNLRNLMKGKDSHECKDCPLNCGCQKGNGKGRLKKA